MFSISFQYQEYVLMNAGNYLIQKTRRLAFIQRAAWIDCVPLRTTMHVCFFQGNSGAFQDFKAEQSGSHAKSIDSKTIIFFYSLHSQTVWPNCDIHKAS